jgi:thiol:disulfide interchange protein DsbD
MGAAMGYALTQPALETFAVLLTLGFGFAVPILALSLSPALGRLLPRPGPWMDLFKQVMAFPLYATAAWLVWVLSVQRGSEGVLAAMVTLLGVAFAAWLISLKGSAGPIRGAAALAVLLGSLAFGWASLPSEPPAGAAAVSKPADLSGPPSETFTQARLDSLIAARQPVFVNLTAAWCISCKVNERVALSSDAVTRAFAERGVVYLKGDWTNGDPEVTALLKRFGRVGVPLYLLYAPGAQGGPQILPQLLTESIVLDRLADALPSRSAEAAGQLGRDGGL